MIDYLASALWSLNERMAGRPGLSLPRLGTAWLDDMLAMAKDEADSMYDAGRGAIGLDDLLEMF